MGNGAALRWFEEAVAGAARWRVAPGDTGALARIDLSAEVPDQETYERVLAGLQLRLQTVQQAQLGRTRRAVIALEGWDAAGKGGVIRRLAWALDPRSLRVWPIAAPKGPDAAQHYLWRFWQRLPEHGAIAVFDRSWYGRVLVERVEKLQPKPVWKRAFKEISAFEQLLHDDGVVVVKIFLHISADEQRRRFEERLRNPVKRWKLSYEDFRNLDMRDAYTEAIDDALARTSAADVPWHVVPAEHKWFGRLATLAIITETLEAGLDLAPRPLETDVLAAAARAFGLALPEGGSLDGFTVAPPAKR